ncbi:MAG TPA: tetratricopeptide repeat protein [Phycisphaerales bacterium]|nr:tetratricopeptide repeat protein [Phycisphaerales bacterium]
MNIRHMAWLLVGGLVLAGSAPEPVGDHIRNVKTGEPIPAFRLPTVEGKFIDNSKSKDKVLVLVYLSAEQKSSELAAAESSAVLKKFKDEPVQMVHVTADVAYKRYFDQLRQQNGIEVPLGLDASRRLYGQLGLIVFPTTIIADKTGKLTHVISTHGPEYPRVLEAYIRHTLGMIDEKGLKDQLDAGPTSIGSPKSLASRHRAAARLLRDKGLIEDARRELIKALAFDPENPNIRLDLADVDLSAGQNAEALEMAMAVLEKTPTHRLARQLAGIAKFKLGEIDEAKNFLTEALELNPQPARALYYLGRIEEMQGNTRVALLHYRESAERLLGE